MTTVHLRLRSGVTLCRPSYPPPDWVTVDSLHSVSCDKCLEIATTIVHAARRGRVLENG